MTVARGHVVDQLTSNPRRNIIPKVVAFVERLRHANAQDKLALLDVALLV